MAKIRPPRHQRSQPPRIRTGPTMPPMQGPEREHASRCSSADKPDPYGEPPSNSRPMYSRRPPRATSPSPSHSANGAHTTPTPHSAPKRRAPSSATSSTTSTTTSPTSTSKTSLLYGNAHTFLPLSHSERRPVGVPNPSCAYMRTGCTPVCHANPPKRNSTGSHWYSSAHRDASLASTQA